jgi:outer membrane protein assembly factor BamB
MRKEIALVIDKKFIENWQKDRGLAERKKRRKFIILGIILGVCLALVLYILIMGTDLMVKPKEAITVKANPGEWPMYGRDLVHSGLETLSNVTPQGTISKILTAEAGLHASPVIANGVIYIGSRDGNLYAIQESDGQKLWSYKVTSWVEGSVAVVNNIVYFGSNDGTFNAVDAKTGKKVWSYFAKYPIRTSPAVTDGKVYFGCDDYKIYCLNAATGKKVWIKETNGNIDSSPAIADGVLYAGSADGNLYAVNASNGHQRFRLNTGKGVSSSPVAIDNKVYFITSDATLYAADGMARNWFGEFVFRPPWQVLHFYGDLPAPPPPSGYLWALTSRGESSLSSPTLFGDKLYIGIGKKVACVDTVAKGKKWQTSVSDSVIYAGVLSQDTVYATTANGQLYLLNASSGEIIKNISVSNSAISSPLMVNGKIYVGSDDGILYQIR